MYLYLSVLDLDKMTQLHSSVTQVPVLVLSFSSSSSLSNSLLVIQMCRFAFFFISTLYFNAYLRDKVCHFFDGKILCPIPQHCTD